MIIALLLFNLISTALFASSSSVTTAAAAQPSATTELRTFEFPISSDKNLRLAEAPAYSIDIQTGPQNEGDPKFQRIVFSLLGREKHGKATVFYNTDYKDAYLVKIDINKERQNKGWGTLLLKAILAHLKKLGFEKMILDVESGPDKEKLIKWYAKHGAKIIEERPRLTKMQIDLSK